MKMKKVKIKLEKPHTHAGKEYEAGDEIEVSERQAEWLEKIEAAIKSVNVKRSAGESEGVKNSAGESAKRSAGESAGVDGLLTSPPTPTP